MHWRQVNIDAHLPVPTRVWENLCQPTHYDHGDTMPYVNIKITNEGATTEQKAELISGVTELLQNVLGKNPKTTVVVIDEVETDNWGIGGETVTELRKQQD